MEIITKKEAVAQGLSRYFTGKPCSSGHVCERRVDNSSCMKCLSIYSSRYFNKKSQSEKIEFFRQRYAKDPTRSNKYVKAYFKANPDKKNAYTAKRAAAKLNATPAWADLEKIRSFYEEAARLTAETGIPHHVDHMVPLQGKTVCGFHVENNLQVITARENHAKSNTCWPDMWSAS